MFKLELTLLSSEFTIRWEEKQLEVELL